MIDWSRVIELQEEVGADDFDEVVELFLEEVEAVIERLRDSPEPERLEEDLHFLKGSAMSLGFREFSTLCQVGERASSSGCATAVDIAGIIHSFETSKTQFIGHLAERLVA